MTDTAYATQAAARVARILALEAQRMASLVHDACAADRATICAIVTQQHVDALAFARRTIF